MAKSTKAADLSRRALPMELHEVILKFFLTDLSIDDPNKSFSRACSPSLVSKLFLEVSKPNQLKRVSALSLNAHPNGNKEAQRALQYFNDHPCDRELVKRIQLFIGAGPRLFRLSLEYEETPDINGDQVIYVRSAFTGIRFLELTKVAELYLPVFLSIPSIETLKLNGCLFCLTVELDPYEMPVADSNIRMKPSKSAGKLSDGMSKLGKPV
ncbi:hypothetical protein BJ165DRAFT_1411361 [Panaeolus papilionaceus]|nr:hypothetical protein BJ165DRAFT_1411361 [Panaeolus papilionaceus]